MSKKDETLLENKIVDWLETKGAKTIKLHGSPYLEKGTPDRLVSMYVYNSKTRTRIPLHFLLEIKTDKGILSEAQQIRIYEWDRAGMLTVVARSIADVERVLSILCSIYEPVTGLENNSYYEV